MYTIQSEHFTQALLDLLRETFEQVDGHYLDPGDSLFETLSRVSAAQASIPVGGRCATLAAQVSHVAYYIEAMDRSIHDPAFKADWNDIWRNVSAVTPAEWEAILSRLHASYTRFQQLVKGAPAWGRDEISGGLDVLAHCAYHLGEIRQALCILRG